MEIERQEKSKSVRITAEIEMEDSFIFSSISHLHSSNVIMNPESTLSYFHVLTQIVR